METLIFSPISETDMPGVVFAGIEASAEAHKVIMSSEDITEDRNRADTPDSSGGGYFTLSESDTGSNLGTESPHPFVERCNDIYKISKTYNNDDDTWRSRRKRSTSSNFSIAAEYFRVMTNESQHPVKPPPRPPRTSSLPPPIPNKSPEKKKYKRAESLAQRNVLIPEQRPLDRPLPLQIQSPYYFLT